MNALDRYMSGEPLNDALAAMREGRIEEDERGFGLPIAVTPHPWKDLNPDRPLTDADRLDLRELLQLPGWTVLIRLSNKLIQKHTDAAISKSQISPLANAEAIAEEWAMVGMYKRAMLEILALGKAETGQLERDERR